MVIPEDRVEIDFRFCRGDNNRIKSKWLTFYSTSYDTLIEFKKYLIEAERFPLIKKHRFNRIHYHFDRDDPERSIAWKSLTMGASKLSESELQDILACWAVHYNQIYKVLGEN